MRLLALAAAVLALAAPARLTPVEAAAAYLGARQQPDGGFAERGRPSDPALTAWIVLGLASTGQAPAYRELARDYLAGQPYPTAADLALRILALKELGANVDSLADDLAALRRPDGRIGQLVNSTAWGVIALRAAGRDVPAASVRYLRGQQHRSGGWSWLPGGPPDSNDTAAVVQALRAAGVQGRPIDRALAYLRRLQGPSGGFALVPGRPPDAQSTAWALQAFAAAGKPAPRAATRFLLSLYRGDGSFRYSRRYVATPALVTAQVLPALTRKAFPLP